MEKTNAFIHRACPLCGTAPSSNAEMSSRMMAESMRYEELVPYWNGFFKERIFFSYARCEKCGLLYTPTFFDSQQLGDLYAQMPPNMEVVPLSALRATQRGYYDLLRRHAKLERGYLEVGPDIGLFTENCVKAGKFDHYWLFEPNRDVEPMLSAVVRDQQFSVIHDMFDFSPVPDDSVGAAVMIHVLDHLLDPLETLHTIRRKLGQGGEILIVTHDESSLLRKLFGSKWPPFCLQHPQLYNPRSMRALLAAAGYRDVKIKKTVNYFPVQFLLKQFLWACGLKVERVPSFGGLSIGLKLGNMMTLASA